MAYNVFEIVSSVGGSASNSASAGAAAFSNLTAKTYALRIVTDGYVRIQFGATSGILASASSPLYAPGQTIVSTKERLDFYSTITPSSTANYSIDLVTIDPSFGAGMQ